MPKKKSTIFLWSAAILVISLFLGWVDWISGQELGLFVFFFIPVTMAAWQLGILGTVAASIFCATIWYAADFFDYHNYSSNFIAFWNTMIRLVAFVTVGWAFSQIRGLLQSEKQKGDTLRQTMAELKLLKGFLPICAQCKRIRDEGGRWQVLETYISSRTDAAFTHGLCPDCAREILAESGIVAKPNTIK